MSLFIRLVFNRYGHGQHICKWKNRFWELWGSCYPCGQFRVAILSPLEDDNISNDIETDADAINRFKVGSTVPHKVKLYDCDGNDVTTTLWFLGLVGFLIRLRCVVDRRSRMWGLGHFPFAGPGGAGYKFLRQGFVRFL